MTDAAGLQTERLVLRRFTRDDLPLLLTLNGDERVMRYIGGVASPADTERMLSDRIIKYYDERPALGVWATCLRSTGGCIGFHLLNEIHGETLVQLGYRLFPQHWGKGYATEMGIALMRYGYERMGLQTITAVADPDNAASLHVLEKCGLTRKANRRFAHPMYAKFGELAYFERSAADWMAWSKAA